MGIITTKELIRTFGLNLLKNKITLRQVPVFIIDVCMAAFSFYFAILLRYDFNIDPFDKANLPKGLLIVLIARGAMFYIFGLYRGIGKYAGIGEFLLIIRAVIVGSIFYIFLLWVFVLRFPRVALIIDPLMLVILLGGIHFSQRILQDIFRKRPPTSARVLIYGAGDAGDMVAREIRKNKRLPYLVCGFIDDDPNKLNRRMSGIPVLGNRSSLTDVVRREKIDEIIIAIPSASGNEIRAIYEAVRPLSVKDRSAFGGKVKISTVPNLREILEKRYSLTHIRDIEISDLIRRKPVEIASTNAHAYLQGKRILVTGAAGSIGYELSRQLAKFDPELLLMVERDENNLFYLKNNLSSTSNKQNTLTGLVRSETLFNQENPHFKYFLMDIGDMVKLEKIFSDYHPQVVFHAAAYKHVPLMEEHPAEAVENNVRNTLSLTRLSDNYGVEKFVNVSTDKAVNPTNIMGATKRITELMLLSLFQNSTTKFMTVRFGNVIGSRGSVVTIFQDQLKNGEPLTITDPEMERYFMTIPEAVSLINQACALGEGGEIFILDMGAPIKIVDLAQDMIALFGLEEGKDIEIVFVGVRSGEKKCEELWYSRENPQPTVHKKILRAQYPQNGLATYIDKKEFNRYMEELLKSSANGDTKEIIRIIRLIIPEYTGSIRE